MAHANNAKQTKTSTIEILNPCTCCGETKSANFFKSFNPMLKKIERLFICKKCIEDEYQKYIGQFENGRLALYYLCRKFDIFYANSVYESAVNQTAKTGWTITSSYFKQINSFRDENSVSKNGYGICFDQSYEFLDRVTISEKIPVENITKVTIEGIKKPKKAYIFNEEDIKNQEDVLRLLGYDPFENENESDGRFLYSKLVDFLDEQTLDDNFKCAIVIEIVKSFNQIEKINQALVNINVEQIAEKVGDVKALMQTKTSTLSSILAMAKDNGISVNHSNNKSKGAGTLSGIIKKLGEMDLNEAKVNLFDIETSMAIKQIADISNRSILDQLNFDENDYTEIIKDQKKMIEDMDSKLCKLEEENRIFKYNKVMGGA